MAFRLVISRLAKSNGGVLAASRASSSRMMTTSTIKMVGATTISRGSNNDNGLAYPSNNNKIASQSVRLMATKSEIDKSLSLGENIKAPNMVYIAGEEMTHYACQLIVEQWIKPYFDISQWEYYDLSCKSRDETNDKVLSDAVNAGKRIGAIFKEPTITPSALQVQEMGLSKAFGSPNGAMRRGWNGITISRDTIHIEGIELGYKKPVFFERHAVGGEYGAGWNQVGQGTLLTTYLPKDNSPPFVVDKRDLQDDNNVVVVYHNPYDNVSELAHLFFQRCLENNITPYVVTKKTVFKWQEGFWSTMKQIFDEQYKEQFVKVRRHHRSCVVFVLCVVVFFKIGCAELTSFFLSIRFLTLPYFQLSFFLFHFFCLT